MTVIRSYSFQKYAKKGITDNILHFGIEVGKSLNEYNRIPRLSFPHQLNYLKQQVLLLEADIQYSYKPPNDKIKK